MEDGSTLLSVVDLFLCILNGCISSNSLWCVAWHVACGAWPLLTSPRTAEPMLMADDAHPEPHQWGAVDGSEIHHQLRLAVYPIIYRVLYMPGGWPWDFWTINSMFKTKNSLGKQLGLLTLSCFCEMLQKIRILARKIFADLSCENGTCLFPQVFTLRAEIHNLDSLIIQQTTQIDHKWEKEILNLDNESFIIIIFQVKVFLRFVLALSFITLLLTLNGTIYLRMTQRLSKSVFGLQDPRG